MRYLMRLYNKHVLLCPSVRLSIRPWRYGRLAHPSLINRTTMYARGGAW